MTARLGQLTLIITIIAVGYFMFSAVQGSVKTGVTFTNTGSSLEDGLTAHWTFDGPNMVSNVADVSGNGLNLNLTNFTSTTTVSGKVGQALSFDGVDDFAEESSVLLTNVITASDGTISLWMKPTGAPKSNATGYELPSFFGDRWGYMGIIRGVIGSNDRIWAYNYDSDP